MSFSLSSSFWNFPSNNFGQIVGIADSGVETFNGNPIKSLAREICQNSIDANANSDEPTRVEFSTFKISEDKIPGYKDLEDAFKRSLGFWSGQKNPKTKKFFNTALKKIMQQQITCLRISDFNTKGLTGSKEEYNSPWCNLTKSSGASDKTGNQGGSFGIGKFAPYACSYFRTVFYSTADIEGVCAYQGIARLTSFKNNNDEITQGMGFFGKEKNQPVYEQIFLDSAYSREETLTGTDIYILGFLDDADWKEKMISAILDGFLYAIYAGKLIVDVEGIEISRDILSKLINDYKPFDEYADEFYAALVSDEKVSPTFVKEITEEGMRGIITLRLMITPNYHRQVAMVRQTGMKIKNKKNISGLIPFAGLLYIQGDELNEYLRNLENPQHVEWELQRAENKSQAKKLINSFTKFIKEKLDELKNDDSEEELDPSVGEYLAAEQDIQEDKDATEGINDTIKDFSIVRTTRSPQHTMMQPEGSGSAEIDDDDGQIDAEDVPGEGSRSGDDIGGSGTGGGGIGNGEGSGEKPKEYKKSVVSFVPAKVRAFCNDKVNGEYTISFKPDVSAENAFIDLYMSAESQSYEAEIISVSCSVNPDIICNKNRIEGLVFTAGTLLKIKVKLNYHDYCSMEVKAYGNKV